MEVTVSRRAGAYNPRAALGHFGYVNSTLIVHWNGTTWEEERSPNPTPGNGEYLTGVAATSARNAWTVGYAGAGMHSPIARWTASPEAP